MTVSSCPSGTRSSSGSRYSGPVRLLGPTGLIAGPRCLASRPPAASSSECRLASDTPLRKASSTCPGANRGVGEDAGARGAPRSPAPADTSVTPSEAPSAGADAGACSAPPLPLGLAPDVAGPIASAPASGPPSESTRASPSNHRLGSPLPAGLPFPTNRPPVGFQCPAALRRCPRDGQEQEL